MRRVLSVLTTSLLAAGALALGAPPPAHAASTEIGNPCVANNSAEGATAVMTGRSAGNPLPVAAPAAGVVTRVRFLLPAIEGTAPTVVKIMRPAGAHQYTVVARSEPVLVTSGVSTFPVRLPIGAGDLLGLWSSVATVLCDVPDATDTVAGIEGDTATGSTAVYTTAPKLALPIIATIEPDTDKDGYGDETQDQCPKSASTQAACPVVRLDSTATAGRKISVLVTADLPTKASVAGKVKVGGKNVELKSKAKSVTPGKLAKITVKLPAALKAALADLPATKTITVKLTVSADNVVGAPSTDKVKVKLSGTGR